MSLPRYLEYKPSGVAWLGEVPGHWEELPLKIVASYNDDVIDETTEADQEILYVDISSVDRAVGIVAKDAMSFSAAPSRARRKVKDGDVIVSTVRTYLRAIARIVEPEENLVVSTGFAVIRPLERIFHGFLGYLLSANFFVDEVISKSVGVSYPAINASDLVSIKVPVPTIEEQQTIAAFLDRETGKIDTLIAEQQRLVELLAEKRQAVISHAVTKGLNPNATMKDSGIEWLDVVPEHWEVKRLKTLSPFISVGIVVNPSEYVSGEGLPFIYGGDITEGKIAFETSRRITDVDSRRNEKTRLSAGDLLTVRVGAPGITAVVPPECEGGNCASVMHVRKGNFNSQWLCYSMNDKTVRYQVEVVQYGAAQEQFNIGHAINFWIATPPLEEQNAIAAFLDTVTAKFATLTAEANRAIALLQEHRSTLISAAVTGKIDVRRHTGAGRYPVDERIPA